MFQTRTRHDAVLLRRERAKIRNKEENVNHAGKVSRNVARV
jgi:hypothetical protein